MEPSLDGLWLGRLLLADHRRSISFDDAPLLVSSCLPKKASDSPLTLSARVELAASHNRYSLLRRRSYDNLSLEWRGLLDDLARQDLGKTYAFSRCQWKTKPGSLGDKRFELLFFHHHYYC